MTPEYKEGFIKSKEAFSEMDKKTLERFIPIIKREIIQYRTNYGIKASNHTLVALYKKAQEGGDGKVFLLPKYLLKDLFTKYEKALPAFHVLPEHVRIAIDVGTYRTVQGDVEIYWIEVSLYEDMCALFNLCKEFNSGLNRREDHKKKIKTASALERATIIHAYFFVEAYLNGLAFDYYIKNEDKLKDDEKEILTEWDSKKNREKHLSLRDKLLKYPRILKESKHPPLQESNCPELSYIVQKSKTLRDSIVHGSPKFDMQTYEPYKENAFFSINFAQVQETVDNAINLVEKLETCINGNCDRIWWMAKRSQDGFFPETVFD